MDQAALPSLHQLPAVDALRIQSAWTHPIEYQGKPPPFGGWGLAVGGTLWYGTQYLSRSPSRMFGFWG
jgi:hypothetical protein